MGPADRDYMKPPSRRSFGHPEPGSVTAWLIFLCILVYVLDRVFWKHGERMFIYDRDGSLLTYVDFFPIEYRAHFSLLKAIYEVQLWRFATFQFLHANFDHLIFNMLTLFFFGPMVERYLTSRQFILFYLLSGAGGAALYMVLLVAGLRIGPASLAAQSPATAHLWVPLIGASAGIFGILVAATRIAPDALALIFGIFPVRLRALTWLFIAYAVFQVLFRTTNAGGEAAHLGGAIVGFLLIRFPQVTERLAWFGKRAPPF